MVEPATPSPDRPGANAPQFPAQHPRRRRREAALVTHAPILPLPHGRPLRHPIRAPAGRYSDGTSETGSLHPLDASAHRSRRGIRPRPLCDRSPQARTPATHRHLQGPRRGQRTHLTRRASAPGRRCVGRQPWRRSGLGRPAPGIPADIFVPSIASPSKVDRLVSYGAQVHVVGSVYQDALDASSADFVNESGARQVHAYDDPYVVAGAGTVGCELSDSLGRLDHVVVACGGGGLSGGLGGLVRPFRADASRGRDRWARPPSGPQWMQENR